MQYHTLHVIFNLSRQNKPPESVLMKDTVMENINLDEGETFIWFKCTPMKCAVLSSL